MFIMGQTMEEILLSRETGEVHFESSSGNRVPRGSNKLFQDMSHRRKCQEKFRVSVRIFMPKVR